MNLFKAAEGNGSQFTAARGADWQAALKSIPCRPLLSSPPRRGDGGGKPSGGRTTGRLLPGSADGSPKRRVAAVGLGTAGSHAARRPCRDGQ